MKKRSRKIVVCLGIVFLLMLAGLVASVQSGGLDSMTGALIGAGDDSVSPVSYIPIILFIAALLFGICYLEKKS